MSIGGTGVFKWWGVETAAFGGGGRSGSLESGSFAIISKRVGLDRVLSGGGDIGFSRPAVRAELNFEKDDGNVSWWVTAPPPYTMVVAAASMGISGGGGGGGDGGRGGLAEAGQHQEEWSGETTEGGRDLRGGWWWLTVAAVEMVVSMKRRRLSLVGLEEGVWDLEVVEVVAAAMYK